MEPSSACSAPLLIGTESAPCERGLICPDLGQEAILILLRNITGCLAPSLAPTSIWKSWKTYPSTGILGNLTHRYSDFSRPNWLQWPCDPTYDQCAVHLVCARPRSHNQQGEVGKMHPLLRCAHDDDGKLCPTPPWCMPNCLKQLRSHSQLPLCFPEHHWHSSTNWIHMNPEVRSEIMGPSCFVFFLHWLWIGQTTQHRTWGGAAPTHPCSHPYTNF